MRERLYIWRLDYKLHCFNQIKWKDGDLKIYPCDASFFISIIQDNAYNMLAKYMHKLYSLLHATETVGNEKSCDQKGYDPHILFHNIPLLM